MDGLLSGLFFILSIWFIVGLIKPSSATWFVNPSRWKVFGIWIAGMFLFGSISIVQKKNVSHSISSSSQKVEDSTREVLSESDTVRIAIKKKNIQKFIEQSVKEEEDRERVKSKKEFDQLKNQLVREIEGDTWKTGNAKTYNGDLKSLQIELITFGAWKMLLDKAKGHPAKEIQVLGKTLSNKVVQYQVKKFPFLRREYSKIAKSIYWKNDIDVRCGGNKNATLEFIGIHFSANKNIQYTQEALYNQLKMFRFKRVNYRWSKYDDEYTYYDVKTPEDSKLYESEELEFEE